jgi:hypothetical protein
MGTQTLKMLMPKMCLYRVFILKVGVKESIVNAPRIMDQLLKSSLTLCVVCVFSVQTDKWCVHNQLFNPNFMD